MAFENERKFLLKNNNWKKGVSNKDVIHQGYIDLSKVEISIKPNWLFLDFGFMKLRKPIEPKDYEQLLEHLDKPEKVLRIRDKSGKYKITLKIDIGIVDSKVEVEPSLSKEEYDMLVPICDSFISKIRSYVKVGEYVYEVDVFTGKHEHLEPLAEVEYKTSGEVIEIPEWAGKEVTGIDKYYNANLAKL